MEGSPERGAQTAPRTPTTTEQIRIPEDAYERYEAVFGSLPPPFAFVDLDALWANAADMLRRAAGKPIRVATKSVRCRAITQRILGLDPGFQGLLTYTLPETLFLWEQGFRNLLLAYPTTDRDWLIALARLTGTESANAPVVMVDCPEHLDLIESAIAAAGTSAPIRVAIELDTSYHLLGGRIKIGPKRSPIRTPEAAVALAREINARQRVELVGMMAYEGHIAGVGDAQPRKPFTNLAIRAMQRASAREIRERRAEVVDAVLSVADLEFVNGGGTGSISSTAAEPAVTEVAAGSGFYAPVLFDHYRSLRFQPAAMFALPIVRKPGEGLATALGGGYLASGPGGKDRLPEPFLPTGLKLDPLEGAGEVQTPLIGAAADELTVGDRVYFRHVKAGELCERFNSLYLIARGTIVDEVKTYRGEGQAFL
jgi:D-serine deaminase-like pyridoxal phosphate-dependent protein